MTSEGADCSNPSNCFRLCFTLSVAKFNVIFVTSSWTFSNSFSSSVSTLRLSKWSRCRENSAARDRKIIRLTGGGSSAIGILYDVREENVAFLEFSRHFRRHGLPVPEIYGEDLAQGAYLEEDFGDTTLFEFLSKHRAGDKIAPEAVEAYRKSHRRIAPLPGRGRARSELQSLLSARQLRSPVDLVGLELFQVLLPSPGGHRVQRTSPGR